MGVLKGIIQARADRRLDSKIVYRRYASLFFIAGCNSEDNELITLEIVHRYVEQMDKYYGNVCELDIIFNFQKVSMEAFHNNWLGLIRI